MLQTEQVTAFLATADAPVARNFFENKLGLTCVSENDFAIVFDLQGTELRIQKVARIDAQPHTMLGWSVTSLEKTAATLVANGIEFVRYQGLEQNETGIWHSPSGAKIAWFKDPDGNVLSLTEHG